MKIAWMLVFLTVAEAGAQTLKPGIYHAQEDGRRRKIGPLVPVVTGNTDNLRILEAYYVTTSVRFSHFDQNHDVEELIMVTDGSLLVTINDKEEALSGGDVAIILPGDSHSIENADGNPVTYFLVTYASKDMANAAQLDKAGESQCIKAENALLEKSTNGESWTYPERGTVMCANLRVSRTQLNPQTEDKTISDGPGDLLLVYSGSPVLQNEGNSAPLKSGDVVILSPDGTNYITNPGTGVCQYVVVGL